jgi:hypothetical protein
MRDYEVLEHALMKILDHSRSSINNNNKHNHQCKKKRLTCQYNETTCPFYLPKNEVATSVKSIELLEALKITMLGLIRNTEI